ncbi:MAG: hypothetical protein ACYC8S_03560 [Minisyncoccota bacterium]
MQKELVLGVLCEQINLRGLRSNEVMIIATEEGLGVVRPIPLQTWRRIPLGRRGYNTLVPMIFVDEMIDLVRKEFKITDTSRVVIKSKLCTGIENTIRVDLVIDPRSVSSRLSA